MDLDFGDGGGVVAVCAHFWGMEGRGEEVGVWVEKR